jgi:hypothetical protein
MYKCVWTPLFYELVFGNKVETHLTCDLYYIWDNVINYYKIKRDFRKKIVQKYKLLYKGENELPNLTASQPKEGRIRSFLHSYALAIGNKTIYFCLCVFCLCMFVTIIITTSHGEKAAVLLRH